MNSNEVSKSNEINLNEKEIKIHKHNKYANIKPKNSNKINENNIFQKVKTVYWL